MDDFILMPPPAPRFKRPRDDTTDDSPAHDEAVNDTAKPLEAHHDSQFRELYCISPPEDLPFRSNTADGSNETSPNAMENTNENPSEKKNLYIPPVSFRDIIGQSAAKLRLDEALLPLALPVDLVENVLTGIRAAPTSILLHGPPGCGKTKLAQALAGEANAAFFSVGPSDVLSKFVGESEASLRGLFRDAQRKARKTPSKCSVIFFDEIDALGRSRVDEEGAASQAAGDNSSRRVLAELLIQMTELTQVVQNEEEEVSGDDEEATVTDFEENLSLDSNRQNVESPTQDKSKDKPRVIVVAATNRPEDCDPALLRRFAVRVLVGLPTKRDRKRIISRLLKDVNHSITKEQLDSLAASTEGWSGSDLESMTRESVMAPVRETLRAAAILKKRAAKKQNNGAEKVDAADATRESLLNGFRNLRPVTCQDFEEGIAFFLGDAQSAFLYGERASHYDSSDSEDEAEDE